MTRPLKFRAYDLVKKKWVLDSKDHTFNIIGEVTVFDMLKQYSIKDYNRIEIQQYTGLEDANGKPIFEGDIVRCLPSAEFYRTVVFYKGEYLLASEKESIGIGVVYSSHPETVIVGNIFDSNVRHT